MTTSPEENGWGANYDELLPTFERMREEVAHILEHILADLKVHDIRVRVKKKSSFLEKIERKRYDDPFSQMTDLIGSRVVCLFLDDIPRVEDLIANEFLIVEKQTKIDETKPEIFGYQSVHYLCRFEEGYSGPRYSGLHNFVFEVQLRTILQDAWAVVEHTLAYKGGADTPPDLRRDFSALAGLLHVADRTFQHIRDRGAVLEGEASQSIRLMLTGVGEAGFSAAEDIAIDRNTLKAFLAEEFPDREPNKDRQYAQLVEELALEGITGIFALKDILDRRREEFLDKENKFPPRDDEENLTRYTRIGAVRRAMHINNPNYTFTEID
ncbi:GTP pyrophosphokinase family protein [Nocardia sp. NPDC057227]|uniref:GTP pyrophosphokinase n=1 Tax=Nocardia sp. NPDC057227 TaxID=3346056 RepID=UPI003630B756